MEKLPEPYRGSQIEASVRRAEVHVVHHGLEPSRALMVFTAWLVALGVLGLTAGGVVTGVFATVTFAVLFIANQAGWAWVRR